MNALFSQNVVKFWIESIISCHACACAWQIVPARMRKREEKALKLTFLFDFPRIFWFNFYFTHHVSPHKWTKSPKKLQSTAGSSCRFHDKTCNMIFIRKEIENSNGNPILPELDSILFCCHSPLSTHCIPNIYM